MAETEEQGVVQDHGSRAVPGRVDQPKWTPGPWKICGGECSPDWDRIISKATYDTIAAIREPANKASSLHVNPAQELANAHLIAAAPELYEMTALLKRSVEYDIRRSEADGDDEGAAMKRLTLARVDAALAKSRGEA